MGHGDGCMNAPRKSQGIRSPGVARIVLLGMLLALGGSGCADSPQPAAAETRTIVDSLGRRVEVPTDIYRLVSFNSDLTEVIFALGAADKIVAPGYRVSQDQAWLSDAAPDLADLPTPQSPAGINEEELAALEPDLIVSALFGEVGADEVVKAGERLDVPVVIISFEAFAEYFDDVELLARTLGVDERGEELIARLRQVIEDVEARTRGLSPADRPRVYHGVGDVYHTLGKGIFEDDQIRLAGGVNVASSVDGFGVEISVEQLLEWDPEVIVVLWEANTKHIFEDRRLSDIEAVRERHIYRHPEQGWGFATPRAIFAVAWLGAKLHADRFADVDLEREADDFYQDVYRLHYWGPPLTDGA